jgi:hypothetical protein
MKYTKHIFGNELKKLVDQKQDVATIGAWAYSAYLDYTGGQWDNNLLDVMIGLTTMELGPEFIRSNETLHKIADDLIAGKDIDLNAAEYRDNNDALG